MHVVRTERTYKTRENALKALAKVASLDGIRYLIAATEDGRFAPVVVGADQLHLAFEGITVVG
jgi:hypothetical protein